MVSREWIAIEQAIEDAPDLSKEVAPGTKQGLEYSVCGMSTRAFIETRK